MIYVIIPVILSSILTVLDGSIINIILPRIAQSFAIQEFDVQWVVSSYFILSVCGIIFSSYLQTKGIKVAWITGNMLFLLGSLFVGLSFNFTSIILARALQGFGGGILLPLSQTVLVSQFGKENASKMIGLVSITTVFVPAVAPILGVFISDLLSWKALFLMNIPMILCSIYLSYRHIENNILRTYKINILLLLWLFLCICSSFYFLDYFKNNPSLYSFSFIAGVLFCLAISLYLNNKKSADKIIDFSNFNNKNFSLSILLGFIVSFLFYGFMILFPILVKDRSLLEIAILLSLQGCGAIIGRKYLNKYMNNIHPFTGIGIGVMLSAISFIFLPFDTIYQGIGFVVRGMGLGVATIICLSAPFTWSDKSRINDTSIITRIMQQLGGACAGIFVGVLVYAVINSSLTINTIYIILFVLSFIIGLSAIFSPYLIKNKETSH